jgi:predicted HicB family RNase H-like nuclease
MSDTLKYKGYIATVHFSTEDEVFHGKVIGINDLVTFEGSSVTELKDAFKEAVEDYLELCKELNRQPDKMYKGSFNVRVPMNLHRKAALIASQKNWTLNEFMKAAIQFAIKHEHEVGREMQGDYELV